MRKIKYFLTCMMSGILLAAGLSACSTTPSAGTAADTAASTDAGDADAKKTLTMAVGAELNTLYPLNMDQQNYVATKLCYEGLVNYNDGSIEPCLAKSWEFSDGGKALTFYLQEGISYHDGTPFNAEAVKTVFDFGALNPNFGGIAAVANLQSIEVVDEYTVTFHYPAPYFAYLSDFCYPEVMILVSPKAIEEGNFQSMKGVIGTGPYIHAEISDGNYVRFVRNEDYWGEKPWYDEVIIKYIPEASARLQALRNKEVDLLYGSALLSWDDYDQAVMIPGVAGAVSGTDSATRNLILNASGLLADPDVREAVACAIDKQALCDGLTYGNERPAAALFPENIPYAKVPLHITRTFDQDQARTLLDEAGWLLNDATGIREKDGRVLTLRYTYDTGESMNKPLATAIKSQLREVGIEVQSEGQEMMTWWQEGLAGNYDLTMWDTEQPYTSPHNFFIPMVNRSPHVPSLAGLEGSDQFQALILQFQQTDDPVKVQSIFDELLNYDNDNLLDLPLMYSKDMVVYNTETIAGYEFTGTPMFFDIRKVEPVK